MEKVYAEIEFGNETFLSTEIENNDSEYRIPKFIKPKKINEYYFRFWVFKTIFIISTNSGLKMKKKDKNRLKILFGLGGEN
ncbi:MAG: DUF3977 family protein [Candidatus Zambryskibacteria bacterium]|nr:DUF3977 family protein [Candidatus Zambryskibacteria bacterium]